MKHEGWRTSLVAMTSIYIILFSLPAYGQAVSIDKAVAIALSNHPAARSKSTIAQQAERALMLDELARQVKAAYMEVVYCGQRLDIMRQHAAYFDTLIDVAEIRLTSDSINQLPMVSAGSIYAAYQSRMYAAQEELNRATIRLCLLLYITGGKIETEDTELNLYQIHHDKTDRFDAVKHKALYDAKLTEAKKTAELEKNRLFSRRARIIQAETDAKQKIYEIEYRKFADTLNVEALKSLLNQHYVQISFYRENLLVEANLILENIENDFATGRITDYTDAFTRLTNAVSAKLNHLEYVYLYNQTALELEYLTQ